MVVIAPELAAVLASITRRIRHATGTSTASAKLMPCVLSHGPKNACGSSFSVAGVWLSAAGAAGAGVIQLAAGVAGVGQGLVSDGLEPMLATPYHRVASRPAHQALRASADWLASSALDNPGATSVVLGHGDPNLANFLWDGTRVRIIDFEDSGPSYRAFDLALLVEHISAWSESGLDAAAFLGLFDLTTAELAMLHQFRRPAATYWLIKLHSGHQAHPSTHDAVNRQAQRLLALLR